VLAHLSKLLGREILRLPNNLNIKKLPASGEGRKYENASEETENESPYFEQEMNKAYTYIFRLSDSKTIENCSFFLLNLSSSSPQDIV